MDYGIYQNQVSLVPLLSLETSLPVKAAYLEAMRLNARLVEERLGKFRKYDPGQHTADYRLAAWRQDPAKGGRPKSLDAEFPTVREPCEAMCVILLAADKHLVEPEESPNDRLTLDWIREQCRELLSTYHYDKLRTFGMIYAEVAYWRAVKLGLFKYDPKLKP